MIKVLLWLWQLPQHLLALLVILFTRASRMSAEGTTYWSTYRKRFYWAVSLGNYILVSGFTTKNMLMHEHGHQLQSMYLGPLYLVLIGLPSFTFNIADRLFHKKWADSRRAQWDYSLPWEAWADKLGGVQRTFVKHI